MSILVDKDTTFIIQGITGREAVNTTRECLDYGAKVVGGVTPGRKGRDVFGVGGVSHSSQQIVIHPVHVHLIQPSEGLPVAKLRGADQLGLIVCCRHRLLFL